MSKQLEAELRAERNAADDAVDVAVRWLDRILDCARGQRIVPAPGTVITPGTPMDPAHAVINVPIPMPLLMEITTAVNAWRKTKGTVN